jgi:Uri superfamily endonuclease
VSIEGLPSGIEGLGLPEAKGTYVLIARVSEVRRLEIRSLGAFDLVPGFYAYLGSALGSGGLRARVGHHLEATGDPHWHIDYLLRVAVPVEVWFTAADRRLERPWAELLERGPGLRAPISRFGASDYHRSRASHLFYSKRRPSFEWFRQRVREGFEGVEVQQMVLRGQRQP